MSHESHEAIPPAMDPVDNGRKIFQSRTRGTIERSFPGANAILFWQGSIEFRYRRAMSIGATLIVS